VKDETVRALAAFEMYEVGVALKRSALVASHPAASDAEINQLLNEWLQHRPGAEHGDAAGVPVDWEEWKLRRR